jgi:arylsulfatase A-like enzyme
MLVVLCSFRPDRIGATGSSGGLMPFLDCMASEGTRFENAVSASSWTKPSLASLMTALTPGVHGMRDFYRPEEIASGEAIERRVLPEGFAILPAAPAGAAL